MKLLLVAFLVFVFANAVPDQNDGVEIHQVEVIEIPWQEEPQQEYGPPKQQYVPPSPKPVYGPPPKPVYGPPLELTTTESETTTTEYPTTTVVSSNVTSNSTNTTRKFERLENDDSADKGVYYIYHSNGILQRVLYASKDNVENMEYTAQLKYHNVEPIKGPIYTYDPETYIFSKINKK